MCAEEPATSGSSKKNRLIHNLTFIYRYTMEEMHEILNNLNNYTDSYQHWCRTVEAILELRNSKLDNSVTSLIDLESEEETARVRLSKKPSLHKLLELLERAKLNKFPCYTEAITNSAHNICNSNNLFVQLEQEFKNAGKCAEMCYRFIDVYRNSQKRMSIEDKKPRPFDMSEEDEQADNDVIFVKRSIKPGERLKKRISLEQLKILVENIDKLVCEIEEHRLLDAIFSEALEQEKKLDKLIAEWNLESPNQLKSLLNYLAKIDVEFPPNKVEQLRLMHKQAVWLSLVNMSIQNPAELTISLISELIDRLMDDNLLQPANNHGKQIIEKTFVDLQELLSIAQTWDARAKEQIESK